MTQQRRSFQVGSGLFILLGFAALAYLATQTTSVANFSQGDSYVLKARFTNIGQLKLRAPVKIAGVRIGSVESIELDPAQLDALVRLSIDKRYQDLPDDSSAAIFTSGLLGDQYVGVQPGGSPEKFKDGDEFVLTQSSMQLEDLIGKFLVNGSPQKPADDSIAKPSTDSKPDPAKPAPNNPDIVKPDSIKSDSSKPDPIKSESSKPESSKPAPSKPASSPKPAGTEPSGADQP